MIKKIILNIINKLGYNLEVINNKPSKKRNDMEELLSQVKKYFYPENVLDIGAAYGHWSCKCSDIFPKAKYFLFEPLEDYKNSLEKLVNNSNFQWIKNVVSDKNGFVYFNKHIDLVGSSLKKEVEGKMVDGKKIKIKAVSLDKYFEKEKLKNILLKIDVQGCEIEVLKGASKLLRNCECIILEGSLFKSIVDGNDIFDLVSYMKKAGFVLYDLGSNLYRPYDNALSQVDMVFVKEKSKFRKFIGYASKSQRKAQNNRFIETNKKNL